MAEPEAPDNFQYQFQSSHPASHMFAFNNGTHLSFHYVNEVVAALWLFRAKVNGERGLLSKCCVNLLQFGEAQRRADRGERTALEVWKDPDLQVYGQITLAPLPGQTAIFDGLWPGAGDPSDEWLLAHAALIPHRSVWALCQPRSAACVLGIEP